MIYLLPVSEWLYGRDPSMSAMLGVSYTALAFSSMDKVRDAAKQGLGFWRRLILCLLGIAIVSVIINLIAVLSWFLFVLLLGPERGLKWASGALFIPILVFSYWILD